MAGAKATPANPVEIVSERRVCAKVFDIGGGMRRASITPVPQHVPDDVARWLNGQSHGWVDVDTAVRAKPNGKLAPAACWYGVEIDQDGVGYTYTSILTGGTVSVRLLELDGVPVGTNAPPPTVESDGVWWRNFSTQLDFHLDVRPDAIEMFKRLRGGQAARSFLWRVTESADRSIALRHETFGHDNADLQDPQRADTGVARIRRNIQMAAPTIGPESANPDGSVTYTVLERWTGMTIALDRDRVKLLDAAVAYPVLIDTVISETPAANGDDGHQIDTAGTWQSSYGSTGKHIIYDPSSGTVAYFPGWRFTTVPIDQGSTINSATLTLTLSNSSSGTGPTATVYGWAHDNAPAWANGAGPVQATRTTASAAFGTWGGGASGARVITVTGPVQEIVSRAGFANNNALSLFALYTPNNNSSFSYINDLAGGTTGIAKLDVDFTPSASGITGTLGQTLGAVTASGTGTVDISGSLGKTLAALGLVGTGTVDVSGSGSATLAAVATTGSGAVDVSGALTQTLGDLTAAASGSVDSGIAGSLSQTLGTLSASGSGTVDVAGTLSKTLGALAVTAAGDVAIEGALSKTLGSVTLSAAGNNGGDTPVVSERIIRVHRRQR